MPIIIIIDSIVKQTTTRKAIHESDYRLLLLSRAKHGVLKQKITKSLPTILPLIPSETPKNRIINPLPLTKTMIYTTIRN